MVPGDGIAPSSQLFQSRANLSQLAWVNDCEMVPTAGIPPATSAFGERRSK